MTTAPTLDVVSQRDRYVLLRAGVSHSGQDVLGAQRLQISDGDRSPVGAVLRGYPRITAPLSSFHYIAGEAAVVHEIDAVRSVRREVAPQRPARGVEGVAGLSIG